MLKKQASRMDFQRHQRSSFKPKHAQFSGKILLLTLEQVLGAMMHHWDTSYVIEAAVYEDDRDQTSYVM
jgi:hemoglobin-like flavoprotein